MLEQEQCHFCEFAHGSKFEIMKNSDDFKNHVYGEKAIEHESAMNLFQQLIGEGGSDLPKEILSTFENYTQAKVAAKPVLSRRICSQGCAAKRSVQPRPCNPSLLTKKGRWRTYPTRKKA